VYLVLASVPSGSVVTYGQVAELAGLPRAARMVGRILGNLPKGTELPWHRVINAAGKISLAEDSPSFQLQKARLQEEGVVLNNNRVSLKKFNWQP
jgi:methylated-DNA-protein-cysteine methyltransferase-like protein